MFVTRDLANLKKKNSFTRLGRARTINQRRRMWLQSLSDEVVRNGIRMTADAKSSIVLNRCRWRRRMGRKRTGTSGVRTVFIECTGQRLMDWDNGDGVMEMQSGKSAATLDGCQNERHAHATRAASEYSHFRPTPDKDLIAPSYFGRDSRREGDELAIACRQLRFRSGHPVRGRLSPYVRGWLPSICTRFCNLKKIQFYCQKRLSHLHRYIIIIFCYPPGYVTRLSGPGQPHIDCDKQIFSASVAVAIPADSEREYKKIADFLANPPT